MTIAAGLMVHVGLTLKNVHKGTPGNTPKIMSLFFFAAAVLPTIEFLQNLGSYGMADVMTNWGDFDVNFLPSVEIAFLIAQSRGIWVFSLQFIFYGLAFATTSFLTLRYHQLPAAHAIVGLVCALLSFLVFIFEIVAFTDFETFAVALGVTFGLWSLLVVPVYLIATGIALRKWVPKVYAFNNESKGAAVSDDEASTASEEMAQTKPKKKRSGRSGRSGRKDRVELESDDAGSD
jgi:hypothetical protein